MKYFIITFGCQMNRSDSERIASVLENCGYKPTSSKKDADLIVVNMCSVRQSAVDRVFGLMPEFQKLKNKNPRFKTILTGCFLKEDKNKFQKGPAPYRTCSGAGFDLILDIKDLVNWPEKLSKIKATPKISDRLFSESSYFSIKPKYQSPFSAFVPIMTGCDNFCAYCVVPFTRGREISRPAEEILGEIKLLIKKRLNPIRNAISNGAREIWLLGQNVNSYGVQRRTNAEQKRGTDAEINFAKLLKMVNEIAGNFWIRFTSPHPKDFSEELIETMAKSQKVTPYLNLPVQSGDDKILSKMNRFYTVSQYKNLVKKIRAAFKKYRKAPKQNKFATGQELESEVALSTDIIVGFPGETKKQFENTVKLFKEIKYDMAYVAKYSPRPGTTASKLKDDVSPEEKERRYKILTEILKETALKKNKKYIGKEVEVLADRQETRNKRQVYFGKTRTHKTVKIPIDPKPYTLNTNLVGQFVKVKIIDALSWGLKGILI